MSSDPGSTVSDADLLVKARGLGKAYLIFAKPQDRLKQMIFRRRKFFQEYWAFQNVDLKVRRGEAVGIIGRNGSGKSTLLHTIAGTLQPTHGTIEVSGRIAPLLELGAGFNPEFTGRENVSLAASILGLSDGLIAERFDAILQFAALGDFIDQPIKTYSSGMYARLAFAVAAHVDADLLIVDEILSVGDAAFVQKCMRFIRGFRERGTLLFVSHDTAAVNSLCDRAVWMDAGQVRADGAPKEIGLAYQAALHEETDGQAFSVVGRRRSMPPARSRTAVPDPRHATIAKSASRNQLEVFEFDPDAPSYGERRAWIKNVRFVTPDGATQHTPEGGEEACVEIVCQTEAALAKPILGFVVRDGRGQPLFGDNTYLAFQDRPVAARSGGELRATFRFQLPYLPTGDYALTAAVADGTDRENTVQHWIEEAVMFRVETASLAHGLIGIPMLDINLWSDAASGEGTARQTG